MSTDALKATEAYSATRSTHPRVSLADLEANVVSLFYVNAGEAVGPPGGLSPDHPLFLLTLCFLVTRNGFTIIGKSAPASPENFDAEKARTFAYEDAIKQLWPLMGYALRDRLANG